MQVIPMHESKREPHRAHLSKESLARMRVGEKLYDDEVHGLHVVRGKNGWSFRAHADLPTHVMKQRLSGSPTVVLTLGRFPPTSIKHARTEARRIIAEIKDGRDPRMARDDPNVFTLRQAFEWYKSDWAVKHELRPNTLRNYEYCFARLTAAWHDKPLALIAASPLALTEEHARLTRECGKNTANAAIALLGYIHRHARRTRPDLPAWPNDAVTMHKRKSRAKDGMGPDDVAAWWRELQVRAPDPVRRQLLLFELLSGLRSSDACSAKLGDLADDGRFLYIPNPKGGPEKAFHLPLTQPMLDCIIAAKAAWADKGHPPGDYLFPSARARGGRFRESRTKHNGERLKSGHVLRHSFANLAMAAGLKIETISVLMNHTVDGVTADYMHAPANRKFYAAEMAKVSAKIMECIGP